ARSARANRSPSPHRERTWCRQRGRPTTRTTDRTATYNASSAPPGLVGAMSGRTVVCDGAGRAPAVETFRGAFSAREEQRGLGKVLEDHWQEGGAAGAVDDPVVVREGQRHHWRDLDPPGPGDGPVGGMAGGEDPDGAVRNKGRAVPAAGDGADVGDGE